MRYVVVAGYVTVETDGAMRDVRRDQDLPGDVPAEQVARLLESGAIREVEEPKRRGGKSG